MSTFRVPFSVALALLTCLGGASTARAQQLASQRYRSSKDFAMELRLGPYRPDVDGELEDAPEEERPHAKYFGTGRKLLAQAELDYQFFKAFGSLAIGLSMGYFKQTAKSFVEPGPGLAPTVRSGDSTSLMLVPTALSLVYRFDVAALRWNVPLVPYAKAGLDYVFWSVSDGNGNVPEAGGGRGRGATTGYHAAFGVALMLDIFDPGAAQEFDAETGVNHTYLFAEYRHSEISGLGRGGGLHLGDTTWSAGLMFEF